MFRFSKIIASVMACALCAEMIPASISTIQPVSGMTLSAQQEDAVRISTFSPAIDAVSVVLPTADAVVEISAWNGTSWSDWRRATLDSDDDSDSLESALQMFPVPTEQVRVRSSVPVALHPIRVSQQPATYTVAATTFSGQPHIYSRSEWGSDDSLLFNGSADSSASAANGENGTAATMPSQRVLDCQQAQAEYPQEFRVTGTILKDDKGRAYLWPLSYSPSVKMIVVHHTAGAVGSDKRPGVERMRALYQYHSKTMGWGDIGYNYVIDEDGAIYEGRRGGKKIVGGHAYCNNVGTVGVSLMGNFEIEQPTQAQIHALQWLIKDLADEYGIDVNRSVTFHGKTFSSPIVRHRDLLSTACPGFYLADAFSQVISHVKSKSLWSDVVFPALPPVVNIKERPVTPVVSSSVGSVPMTQVIPGLFAHGGTEIRLNPGGTRRFDMSYFAQAKGARAGSRVAQVVRSSPGLGILLDSETGRTDVRGALTLTRSLAAGDEERFELLLTAPYDEGSYWFEIGGIRFTLETVGRRSRLMTVPQSVSVFTSPLYDQPLSVRQTVKNSSAPTTIITGRVVSSSRSSSAYSSVRSTFSNSSHPPYSSSSSPSPSSSIRVRLSTSGIPLISLTAGGSVNGRAVAGTQSVSFAVSGTSCTAKSGNRTIVTDSVITVNTQESGLIAVENVQGVKRLYRGSLECRVIDGQVAIINILSLEDYMLGISEEPDSEPYEKQRAFAIAARTYAQYYLDSAHRKFSGKPYDASDSPALFQAYTGVTFERRNPRWLIVVRDTAGKVLTYKGQVLRIPYFSSDDGRTRSPAEAGWVNFPSAEVFVSKADPWCAGKVLSGHGVGMSGCGAKGQALEGRTAEEILKYYYPGTVIEVR